MVDATKYVQLHGVHTGFGVQDVLYQQHGVVAEMATDTVRDVICTLDHVLYTGHPHLAHLMHTYIHIHIHPHPQTQMVVFAFGIGSTEHDSTTLVDALVCLCSSTGTTHNPTSKSLGHDTPPPPPPPIPVLHATPRTAFFTPTRRVPWQHAAGCVAGELVTVYPPGIPLVVPGEVVTHSVLSAWGGAVEGNGRVTGASDASLATMLVLDCDDDDDDDDDDDGDDDDDDDGGNGGGCGG